MSSRPARTKDHLAKTRRRLAHLLAVGAVRASVAASKTLAASAEIASPQAPGQNTKNK